MKLTISVLICICLPVMATDIQPDRSSMDIFAGAGVWVPGMIAENSQLTPGPMFLAGVETPMFDGDQFRLAAGYATCGSDMDGYDGVNAVLLNLSYRSYPFYKPYAGQRALEPFVGLVGGGVIAWDSVADTFQEGESTTTGGGMLGAEIGTRMKVGETTFLDLSLAGEWVPVGGVIAGEEDEDLSGIRIQGCLVF